MRVNVLFSIRTLNQLIPWSRVLFEKLTGLQLVKKFLAFYGTRTFITAAVSTRGAAVHCCHPELLKVARDTAASKQRHTISRKQAAPHTQPLPVAGKPFVLVADSSGASSREEWWTPTVAFPQLLYDALLLKQFSCLDSRWTNATHSYCINTPCYDLKPQFRVSKINTATLRSPCNYLICFADTLVCGSSLTLNSMSSQTRQHSPLYQTQCRAQIDTLFYSVFLFIILKRLVFCGCF